MKTNPKILALLQARYTDEVQAIQQYKSHEATFRNRGFTKLADQKKEQAGDELGHAALIAARLALYGATALAFVNPIDAQTGAEVECVEMLEAERVLEQGAVKNYSNDIATCMELRDFDTADILTGILKDEVEHTHEQEVALGLIETIGEDNFLQAMM